MQLIEHVKQFNLFVPSKEKLNHSNSQDVEMVDADELYRKTLIKNFRSIIRPELIELISKFKEDEKWQNKVSIMKLITLMLQDELCLVVDEYLEELDKEGSPI